jgi:hypothetical protein
LLASTWLSCSTLVAAPSFATTTLHFCFGTILSDSAPDARLGCVCIYRVSDRQHDRQRDGNNAVSRCALS